MLYLSAEAPLTARSQGRLAIDEVGDFGDPGVGQWRMWCHAVQWDGRASAIAHRSPLVVEVSAKVSLLMPGAAEAA
jgi:hypothetical protein